MQAVQLGLPQVFVVIMITGDFFKGISEYNFVEKKPLFQLFFDSVYVQRYLWENNIA